MTKKIEVFYTGGGITIAEANIDRNQCAVVSSEAPDLLAVYAYTDEEEAYLPENMIFSGRMEELPPELKSLYVKMLDKLKTA